MTELLEDARTQYGGAVDEESITGGSNSKRRRDKESRQKAVAEGRAGVKEASNALKKGKSGGLTNEEQKKLKPYVLTKHRGKVEARKNLSRHEKQQGISGHLKTLSKQSKRLKKKMKRRPKN